MPKKLVLMGVVFLMSCGILAAQYENEPTDEKFIPEAIWASASGGGYWYTEVQVEARDSGVQLSEIYFFYGGGNWVGPIDVGANLSMYETWKSSNILGTLDYYDTTGFDFYPRVGAVEIGTQGGSYRILVNARTYHSSGYSKSFNGFNQCDGQLVQTASGLRHYLSILNVQDNSSFRCSMALFNCTGNPITVRVWIISGSGTVLNSKTYALAGWDYQAFFPFDDLGLTGNYYNHTILVGPENSTDSGQVMCLAAQVYNANNDPSARTGILYYY